MNIPCPCGSEQTYADCCERYIRGDETAPTAEALMRSRFSAYARGEIDYLVSSHHPDRRHPKLRESVMKWAGGAEFTSLEIVHTEDGGPDDTEGVVEFVAAYEEAGKKRRLREVSRFKKRGNRWFYFEGKTPSRIKTVRNEEPKVGRNDPCPCGSGKKFKKCCG